MSNDVPPLTPPGSRTTAPATTAEYSVTPLPPNEAQIAAVSVLVAEMEVLRNQVSAFMSFEVQMVYFAIGFLGVLVAALTQKPAFDVIAANPKILIFCASVFLIIGLMHIYEKFRVFETVAYIEVHIAAPLEVLTGRRPMSAWEGFLGFCYRHLTIKRYLALLRASLFVIPPVFLIVAFFSYKHGT
jgi:hypothetical protein